MKIIVFGGSGQVGTEILKLLITGEHSIVAPVRRAGSITVKSTKIEERIFRFEDPTAYRDLIDSVNPDQFFCALGTTLKTAGSVEAFQKVDRDYPLYCIQALKELRPKTPFALVSSVGADKSWGVYLSAKHAVEESLIQSGLPYVIARPSFLMSDRKEVRPAEKFIEKVFAPPYLFLAKTFAAHQKKIWKWAPIPVQQVAEGLVNAMPGNAILEGLDFYLNPRKL